ncbi:MAG: hypothetical protein Q7J44_14060 [Pseudotabrizicola sp.]|uniref:hypothetical protein n=1 Tax=Pseudotabrizicola sp. TaxID=2939647 RepID=UPI00271D9639|nr:hypothetical protein [Pseudotabrizicola sp.]MDO9639660.1 hypothetical protein [Pseudotabrizicola sp.]
MAEPSRWSQDEMLRLAARGVLKVDLMGERGAVLVTCDEVAAMAAVLALTQALPDALLKPETLKRKPT